MTTLACFPKDYEPQLQKHSFCLHINVLSASYNTILYSTWFHSGQISPPDLKGSAPFDSQMTSSNLENTVNIKSGGF